MKHNEELRQLIAQYNLSRGLDLAIEGHYVKVDTTLATRIVTEYNKLPALDTGLATLGAYRSLNAAVIDQYLFLVNAGYTLAPWTHDGQPYQNSAEMCTDVLDNKHLYFFTGGEPHPTMSTVDKRTGLSPLEMFRAVHDVFGHAAEGYQFGPRGEENAWIHHSFMFNSSAQRALTTETRGQNSWVNFGPHSHLPASVRPYPDQKAALLPTWACDFNQALCR